MRQTQHGTLIALRAWKAGETIPKSKKKFFRYLRCLISPIQRPSLFIDSFHSFQKNPFIFTFFINAFRFDGIANVWFLIRNFLVIVLLLLHCTTAVVIFSWRSTVIISASRWCFARLCSLHLQFYTGESAMLRYTFLKCARKHMTPGYCASYDSLCILIHDHVLSFLSSIKKGQWSFGLKVPFSTIRIRDIFYPMTLSRRKNHTCASDLRTDQFLLLSTSRFTFILTYLPFPVLLLNRSAAKLGEQ